MAAPDIHAYFDYEIQREFPSYGRHMAFPILWPNEPQTGAGYSCPRVGEVCGVLQHVQGLIDDHIALAGEHISPGFFGYMEGALWSGERAARLIGNQALGQNS
jgi:monoamine oxidase